jgi:hypothetical protein
MTPRARRRARARRLGMFAAGAALLAAGCVPQVSTPPPPPQPVAEFCAPSAPNSPTSYQDAFDGLRHTYTEWASADESVPVALPDGRVVWIFDDTSVGHVQPDGTLDPSNSVASNSFVVQAGACFTPELGGAPLARTSLIPSPGPNEWYWPTSGVVDAANNQLLVFVLHVERTGSNSLDFTILDVRVATFSLPALTLESIQQLPFPTSSLAYGSTSFYDGTNPDPAQRDVYAYVSNERNAYVARTTAAQVLTGPWEFWDGSGWSTDSTQAAPMAWSGIPNFDPSHLLGAGAGPAAQPAVVAHGSGYLLTAKLADAFSDDVSAFTGPTPAGPWTYVGQIADTSQTNTIAYGAYTQLSLPGTSGPVTVYNTNVSPFLSNPPPSTIQTYGPHFVAPDPSVFPAP